MIGFRISTWSCFCLAVFGLPRSALAQCAPDPGWIRIANPSAQVHDFLGRASAIDGNRVVIGVYEHNTPGFASGAAYVVNSDSGTLVSTLLPPDIASGDGFGASVGISGNLAIVGSPFKGSGALEEYGRAYVFNVSTGALVSTLNNPSPGENDRFGISVAIAGTRAVVGAYWDDLGAADAGTAYVFDATTGVEIATLQNPNPTESDQFGVAVAIWGNRVLVGARWDDTPGFDVGSAYVFEADSGDLLTSLHTPLNPGSAYDGRFGSSVAISGDLALVGAEQDTGYYSGTAYVFNALTGEHLSTLSNPEPPDDFLFGDSVALSGALAVVGAPWTPVGAARAGMAHVYDALTGRHLATLQNPQPAYEDSFGASVALSGSVLIVGCPGDDPGG